jgi:hypothetical protein
MEIIWAIGGVCNVAGIIFCAAADNWTAMMWAIAATVWWGAFIIAVRN